MRLLWEPMTNVTLIESAYVMKLLAFAVSSLVRQSHVLYNSIKFTEDIHWAFFFFF